jgi:hypothetical protein
LRRVPGPAISTHRRGSWAGSSRRSEPHCAMDEIVEAALKWPNVPLLRLAGPRCARRLVPARRACAAGRCVPRGEQPHRHMKLRGFSSATTPPDVRLLVFPERSAAGVCRARSGALGLAPAPA